MPGDGRRFPRPKFETSVLQIADEYDQMARQAAALEIQLQELAASKLKQER